MEDSWGATRSYGSCAIDCAYAILWGRQGEGTLVLPFPKCCPGKGTGGFSASAQSSPWYLLSPQCQCFLLGCIKVFRLPNVGLEKQEKLSWMLTQNQGHVKPAWRARATLGLGPSRMSSPHLSWHFGAALPSASPLALPH